MESVRTKRSSEGLSRVSDVYRPEAVMEVSVRGFADGEACGLGAVMEEHLKKRRRMNMIRDNCFITFDIQR
jgi:hypothetical protein